MAASGKDADAAVVAKIAFVAIAPAPKAPWVVELARIAAVTSTAAAARAAMHFSKKMLLVGGGLDDKSGSEANVADADVLPGVNDIGVT